MPPDVLRLDRLLRVKLDLAYNNSDSTRTAAAAAAAAVAAAQAYHKMQTNIQDGAAGLHK